MHGFPLPVLKENPKGVGEMCKVMEDLRNESLQEGIKEGMQKGMMEAAIRMLSDGKYALAEIAAITGLPPKELKDLQNQISI